jgi:hypothetical protein
MLVGTEFVQTVGGKTTAAWAGLGVLAVAVPWIVLVRWQGRPAAEIGAAAGSASPPLLGAGLVLGVLAASAVGGIMLLTGEPPRPPGAPPCPAREHWRWQALPSSPAPSTRTPSWSAACTRH